jgi:polyhydroxyalkanoate synthase
VFEARAPRGNALEWMFFEGLDRARRLQGAMLDALGLGPIEAPYETVYSAPGVSLRRYGTGREAGPVMLIVPAPIKRPYIWDLAPGVSAVQRCLDADARVFLVDWQPTAQDLGLADYADRLILGCADAVGKGPAIVLAHSLGGLFAAIFAALHTERVAGLALLAAPLHFGTGVGIFAPMVGELDGASLPASVPGSFLSLASFQASPETFGSDRMLDLARSLPEPEALRNHLRVERWTLDEFALPHRLVADLAELIAREDRFARGTLSLRGHRAAPSRIAAPLLCVVDPRCRVVPPASVLPFYRAAGSEDKTLLHYHGDVGVSLQHVGMLVGREAHRRLWPEILDWTNERWRRGRAGEQRATGGTA